MGPGPERQKILLFKHTIMNYSSLKSQVHVACVCITNERWIRNQFLIFDDSTFLKWSHTLSLTRWGSAPLLDVCSVKWGMSRGYQWPAQVSQCRDHGQSWSGADRQMTSLSDPYLETHCNFCCEDSSKRAKLTSSAVSCIEQYSQFTKLHIESQTQPSAVTYPGSLSCIQMIWYFNADVAHVSHLTRVPQLISVEAHIEMSSHTWSHCWDMRLLCQAMTRMSHQQPV